MLTPAEAKVIVEAARLFTDPETGRVPKVTLQAWTPDLEVWWQGRDVTPPTRKALR